MVGNPSSHKPLRRGLIVKSREVHGKWKIARAQLELAQAVPSIFLPSNLVLVSSFVRELIISLLSWGLHQITRRLYPWPLSLYQLQHVAFILMEQLIVLKLSKKKAKNALATICSDCILSTIWCHQCWYNRFHSSCILHAVKIHHNVCIWKIPSHHYVIIKSDHLSPLYISLSCINSFTNSWSNHNPKEIRQKIAADIDYPFSPSPILPILIFITPIGVYLDK